MKKVSKQTLTVASTPAFSMHVTPSLILIKPINPSSIVQTFVTLLNVMPTIITYTTRVSAIQTATVINSKLPISLAIMKLYFIYLFLFICDYIKASSLQMS